MKGGDAGLGETALLEVKVQRVASFRGFLQEGLEATVLLGLNALKPGCVGRLEDKLDRAS